MAYLRDYQMAAMAVGDPGLFKRLRKLRVGRFLGRNLRAVARSPFSSFVPGAGPYLAAMRAAGLVGDPGLFSGIAKGVGGLLRRGGGLGRVVRGALPAAGAILSGGGLLGGAAAVGGGLLAAKAAGALFGGHEKRSHRRIDPTNAHALRRAIRRMDSFQKLYRKSVGHLGYTVHRKGAHPTKAFSGRKR